MVDITETREDEPIFKINNHIVRPVIVLFHWQAYPMINIKTGQKSIRRIWTISSSSVVVSMKRNTMVYGSMLGLEPEYEWKELRNGKKVRVQKRVEATPIQQLSWKLNCGLAYGSNNMNMSIRPKALESLIRDAVSKGLVGDTGPSYIFYMCRSNDLRHEMKPTSKDKWMIFPKQLAIKERVEPIDEALRRSKSNWRLKTSVTVEDIIKAMKQ